ncbi:hypothetical protein ACRRTK_003846 [Alexandromys fortis]
MLTLKFKFNPRLGIDNPVLSLAEDQAQSGNLLTPGNDYLSLETLQCHTASCLLDPWNLQRPRFCLLSREEQKNFGFHLLYQLGKADHVVYRVDPGSSAQRHGLREGDRILAVNNNIVDHEDYAMVVRHIRASGPRVLLTVLAQHVHDVVRAQQGSDAFLCPTLGSAVRPRLCHVVKDEGGFGFSITHGCRGSFWLVLSSGGAAERAGVPPGARLLEVNGLWQSGDQVTLLVAAPEVEERCRQLGMPLAAPLAEGWALPAKPRCLNIEKGPQGFGFLLREEKGLDGCLGQFLWEVDPGLPADKAGMKAGDRLVAVAGESVDGLCHEETVSRIRAQGSRVSLIVVDPEADRFFNMVRLSPLLFLENTENAASPLAETKDFAAEDTVEPSSPVGSRQCFLYPGPGGGYGFKLCCVASRPCLFVSQVTDVPCALDSFHHLSPTFLCLPACPALEHMTNASVCSPLRCQVTPGGSAARAGLQMGDAVLEVNGYPVGADNDLNRLQQLTEAEPPLCLKLAARDPQDLEAWISSESGKVKSKRQTEL